MTLPQEGTQLLEKVRPVVSTTGFVFKYRTNCRKGFWLFQVWPSLEVIEFVQNKEDGIW
jgi:hypothetical protein